MGRPNEIICLTNKRLLFNLLNEFLDFLFRLVQSFPSSGGYFIIFPYPSINEYRIGFYMIVLLHFMKDWVKSPRA